MNETRGLWHGKRFDNGEWIEGYYVEFEIGKKPISCIIPFSPLTNVFSDNGIYQVAPSTLGECTGLRDKNGKLIFEGDILGFDSVSGSYVLVEYHNGVFGVRTIPEGGGENYSCCEFPLYEELDTCVPTEVIGNIHDNPELLKGGK